MLCSLRLSVVWLSDFLIHPGSLGAEMVEREACFRQCEWTSVMELNAALRKLAVNCRLAQEIRFLTEHPYLGLLLFPCRAWLEVDVNSAEVMVRF